MAANETYPTYPAPLAAHGPNGQLGAASCDTDEERKANGMSGSRWCQVAANNPFGLGGLADNVTALTRVL